MKKFIARIVLMAISMILIVSCVSREKHVVLMFTNDTHSQILPIKADDKYYPAMGGVERRKVLIDSLRSEHPAALLVDAGDAVQGTGYFKIFAGEVETFVMNSLGYDVRTLGNHEFDNGCEALAATLAAFDGVTVSSNYEHKVPALREQIVPSYMVETDGVKVGYIGLNVNPDGLFFPSHAQGVVYNDPIAVTDSLSKALRAEGADVVVVLSHLGFTASAEDYKDVLDSVLVQNTRGIDLVIGAHSHTLLTEPAYFTDADGLSVPVVQTGNRGAYLGYVDITLATDKSRNNLVEYRLFPVDERYDNRVDADFATALAQYTHTVDSIMGDVVGVASDTLYRARPESPFSNWACDAFVEVARKRCRDKIDFAVLNMGGIRADIAPGEVTLGQIFEAFPFANHMFIVRLKGSDVRDLFEQIANRGGEGVSRDVCLSIVEGAVEQVTIAGKPIDDNRYYNIATLNFLAYGGDGLVAFTRGEVIHEYAGDVYNIFASYVRNLTAQGKSMSATTDGRVTIQ